MKKAILIIVLALLSLPSFARKFEIDRTVTSADGCEWRIRGNIDVGCCPSIKSYDITIEGPCGKHRFQGLQINPDGTPSPIEAASTNTYKMKLYDDLGNEEQTSLIDTQFFLDEMLQAYYSSGLSWKD